MSKLVIALDVANKAHALKIVEGLMGLPVWIKIGLELFTVAGPDFIKYLKDKQFKVFLDLKLFDIPNTVSNAVKAAHYLGVDMLTIHILGGERMVHAATQAYSNETTLKKPIILGVTVLTSTAQGEIPYVDTEIKQLAIGLAHNAQQWGTDGVVASGHEVKGIKENCGSNFLCLSPGIRPESCTTKDDQSRTMTPTQAVLQGSDFIVIGRPIVQSNNPTQTTQNFLNEINLAQIKRAK